MQVSFGKVANELLNDGFAIVDVGSAFVKQISNIFSLGKEFFAQDKTAKVNNSFPRVIEGYLELGTEYSSDKARPDLCESFFVWPRNKELVSKFGWVEENKLHQAMSCSNGLYSALANGIFEGLKKEIAPAATSLEASEVSYLQLNYYRSAKHDRDFLQDEHEDCHLITIVKGSSSGLEIKLKGRFQPVALGENEVLVMPGSILTLMTGGMIPPLYHRVRNNRSLTDRQSLMFFVNPSLNKEHKPWIENETNRSINIRQATIDRSSNFGLPTLEEAMLRNP